MGGHSQQVVSEIRVEGREWRTSLKWLAFRYRATTRVAESFSDIFLASSIFLDEHDIEGRKLFDDAAYLTELMPADAHYFCR